MKTQRMSSNVKKALVVVVALMCLTALPGSSAAVGGGPVSSPANHTDFGAGDEPEPTVLENFSVGGSGDSASLSGPVGGITKGGGLVSDGDTISWSESSPSTSSTAINVTGVDNTENRTVSRTNKPSSTANVTVAGNVDPTAELTVTADWTQGGLERNAYDAGSSRDGFTTVFADGTSGDTFETEFNSATDGEITSVRLYHTAASINSNNFDVYVEDNADVDGVVGGTKVASSITPTFNTGTDSIEFVFDEPIDVSGDFVVGFEDLDGAALIDLRYQTVGREQSSINGNTYERVYDTKVEYSDETGSEDIAVSSSKDTATIGNLSDGESVTESLEVATGYQTLTFDGTGNADLKWNLPIPETTQTTDPVVELNGDASQQVSVNGSLGDGQTVIRQVDNSWLESGDNTATVTLNNSSLPAGSPPMQARVSVEQPAQSARYVSAPYTELSSSDGVGLDWTGDGSLDVTVQGWTGNSWEDARQLSTSQTGDVVLDYQPIDYERTRVEIVAEDTVEIREESIQFYTSRPEVDEASATPASGNGVSNSPVELSINVSDADFGLIQGDEVNVTFYDAADDSELGTDTLTQKGTATATFDSPQGGLNEWYVIAEDSYGASVTSKTFQFRTPAQLEIRDLKTGELVTEGENGTEITSEVSFFGDRGFVDQRNTTDGNISMAGLPADQRFAVTVDAGDAYVVRQAIIPSMLRQQTVWLLPNTADIPTVEPRFFLEDPSNQFDTEESEIMLSRPVEVNGTTEFVAVAGDRVGLNGFDPLLERDQRYRVTVRNPATGAERVLGEFTPTAAETVTLTVQDVEFDSVAEVQGLDWTARYLSNEDSTDQVEFIFRDQFSTQSLSYEIVARDDNSTVLASGTATGNVTVREPVPPGESDTIWVVSWETTRTNGETLSASRQVSSSRLPGAPQLGERWQTAIAMISLFVVAGLFGAASPGVGGIAVASTGGVFFFIGWLPDDTGGLMVLLALFVAVLAFVTRKARGATA